MKSRQNRAPSGRTSNRPATQQSGLQSARSNGSLRSSRNLTDSPHNLHSPIERPSSKMSQSGARSLPASSGREGFPSSARSNVTSGRITGAQVFQEVKTVNLGAVLKIYLCISHIENSRLYLWRA